MFSPPDKEEDEKPKLLSFLTAGVLVMLLGLSNLFVPLYRRFCQQSGVRGDKNRVLDRVGVVPDPDRKVRVRFHAVVNEKLGWEFKPAQETIEVALGEPALAFFKAKNVTNESLVGVATYSMTPISATNYFYKIQCFCFEEQVLDPGDEVLMPLFFYIDPAFDEEIENLYAPEVLLSYTFYLSQNNDAVNGKIEQLVNEHNLTKPPNVSQV